MDKLYLASIKYTEQPYESNDEKKCHALHIVKAEDREQAEDKARKYIEDKTSEYYMYYNVTSIVITETIE
jgi:hypothetical protein